MITADQIITLLSGAAIGAILTWGWLSRTKKEVRLRLDFRGCASLHEREDGRLEAVFDANGDGISQVVMAKLVDVEDAQ